MRGVARLACGEFEHALGPGDHLRRSLGVAVVVLLRPLRSRLGVTLVQSQTWFSITLAALVIATGAGSVLAQPAPRQGACQQIRAACERAGFRQGGAKEGMGLHVDCIRPIMQGPPQPRRAGAPLPQIDPQVVAACKTRKPNFGQG